MVGKVVTLKTTASSTYNTPTGFLEEGGRPEIQGSRVNPPSGALLFSLSLNSAAAFLNTTFWSKK